MFLAGRYSSRNLRIHLQQKTWSREREIKVRWGYELSNPTRSDVLPYRKAPCPTCPITLWNCTVKWRPRFSIPEPMGYIAHSNHHMKYYFHTCIRCAMDRSGQVTDLSITLNLYHFLWWVYSNPFYQLSCNIQLIAVNITQHFKEFVCSLIPKNVHTQSHVATCPPTPKERLKLNPVFSLTHWWTSSKTSKIKNNNSSNNKAGCGALPVIPALSGDKGQSQLTLNWWARELS